jgi:hydroxyisourate hydrolase
MPAKLSTHVLDLTSGRPAAGMKIDLRRMGTDAMHVKTVTTNADGRTESPLLTAESMVEGAYELVFHVRAYYRSRGIDCPFLDEVPVRFFIADAQTSYHVPLLVTPWAYSTYRGS